MLLTKSCKAKKKKVELNTEKCGSVVAVKLSKSSVECVRNQFTVRDFVHFPFVKFRAIFFPSAGSAVLTYLRTYSMDQSPS
jgi:hypothetical protein